MSEKKDLGRSPTGDYTLDDLLRTIKDFLTKDPVKMTELLAVGMISHNKLNPIIKDSIVSFMYGVIGLELATTPNYGGGAGVEIAGTGLQIPLNSETVGLIMLATIGLAALPWQDLTNFIAGLQSERQNTGQAFAYADSVEQLPLTADEKAQLQILRNQVASATLGTQADLATANANLTTYCNTLMDKYTMVDPNDPTKRVLKPQYGTG
jgi:hypothetical protein